MNPQLPAIDARLNVAEQILIGRNLQSRGRVRPGNGEGAVRFHAREVSDGTGFRDDVAVPLDARDVAAPQGESGKGQ